MASGVWRLLLGTALAACSGGGGGGGGDDDVHLAVYRAAPVTTPSMIDLESETVVDSGSATGDVALDIGGIWQPGSSNDAVLSLGAADDPDDLPREPTMSAPGSTLAAVPGTGIVVRSGCGEIGGIVVDGVDGDRVDVRMRTERYPLLTATMAFNLNGCGCNPPVRVYTSLREDASGPCLAAPAGTIVDISASSSNHDVESITGAGCDGSTACQVVLEQDVSVEIRMRVRLPCPGCP